MLTTKDISKSYTINHKILNGLKILMSGGTLPFRGYECGICEAVNDSMALYLIVTKEGDIIGNELDFQSLYFWLNNLSDEQITLGLAGIVIKDYTTRKF